MKKEKKTCHAFTKIIDKTSNENKTKRHTMLVEIPLTIFSVLTGLVALPVVVRLHYAVEQSTLVPRGDDARDEGWRSR